MAGAVVLLSGGMDSAIALRFTINRFEAENVIGLSFDYGQKQKVELEKAQAVCEMLGVDHKLVKLEFLRDFSMGFSANVDPDMDVPPIQDILGMPQPITYVPNRNMIFMSIGASLAETRGFNTLVTGLQCHDEYSYFDTTQKFVDSLNSALIQNRENPITIEAPYVAMSKARELEMLMGLDGNLDFLKHTLTCYDPTDGVSCGVCPSCSERIQAFKSVGKVDPIPYSIAIDWNN